MSVFNLDARIGLNTDDFDRNLENSGSKMKNFASNIGKGIANIAKITVAGVSAAAAGVGTIAKQAVESYADYEQLVGGVETLFKDSADIVQGYAANAYKTAGLSANEYMETVTSFSASLLQSLGGDTEKAAEVADMAITDMSDNANKMGTDIEMIQNAYNGFAKGNFTMLDNLKLGYGGTKEEMERLLDKATELSGIEYDINSFNDIAQAIHVVQTELDITGTTAKEASTTISGSLSSMKSAWQNVLTGVADDTQDFGTLVDNFVESVDTVAGNIMPRVQTALEGVGKLVEGLLPKILEKLPDMLQTTVPSLIKSATKVLTSVVNSIKTNIPMIKKVLKDIITTVSGWLASAPELLTMAIDLLGGLVSAVVDNLPVLLEAAIGIISTLGTYLIDNIPELVPAILQTVLGIAEMLTQPDTLVALVDGAIAVILALGEALVMNIPMLLDSAETIIVNIVTALIAAVPKVAEAAKELIAMLGGGLLANLSKLLTVVATIGLKVVEGIYTWGHKLYMTAVEAFQNVKDGFTEGIQAAKDWGKDLVDNFIGGIKAKWDDFKDTITGMAQKVQDLLGFSEPKEGPLSNFHTYAPDMVDLFTDGIKKSEGKLKNQLTDTASLIGEGFTETPSGRAHGSYNGGNVINITVTSGTIASDYDARRAALMMSQSLASLQRSQAIAVGG